MSNRSFDRILLKTRISISAFIVFLFLFIVSCTHTQPSVQKSSVAQKAAPQKVSVSADPATIALDQKIPTDPKVTVGKLDNGLCYYIRRNTEPKNRAELRLVINAGAALEDDNQKGLAHFIEHMAFQGSEHFDEQEIIDYMASIGMRFGSDVNAFTSLDKTIYTLTLPTEDEGHMVKAFQIFKDVATSLKFDPKEIDSERKVIIEEWRRGRGAQERIRDKIYPVLLKDSKYARRRIIGTLESIQSYRQDDLLRFYKDWYRPDLMAVIAVGDFDPGEIENLIKEQFGSVPVPKNPREHKDFQVPPHNDTLFAIAADPELTGTSVSLYHKFPKVYDWTVGGLRKSIVEQLYNSMLNVRFREIATKPDPPFISASSATTTPIRPLEVYILTAEIQETGIEKGLEALLVESERVARFGFTASEMELIKTAFLRSMDMVYANRESRSSSSHAEEMIRSFLTGEHIPGIEFEVPLVKRFIPGITLEEVNNVGKEWIRNSSRVIVVTAPEKPDLVIPSEAELKTVLASVSKKDINAYEAKKVEGALLDNIPQGSKVVSSRELEGGLIEWKLANGITVVLKPTDFKKDEIIFTAFSPGGTSLASDEDFVAADTATSLITLGGLGKFSIMDLQKKLAGKAANVVPMIAEYQEGLSGAGSPVDLETMFQLIYLRMTAPREDKTIYNILKMQMKQQLPNRTADPATVFNDTWNRLVYADHPRKQPDSLEMLDKMDIDKSFAFYKERYADAGDFIFIFAGSIDPGQMKPLVETYLGALPSINREETWKDVGIRTTRKGILKETVRKGKEPKGTMRIGFDGLFPDYNDIFEKARFQASVRLLNTRLRKSIREFMGGTYSVQAMGGITRLPVSEYIISIEYTCDPARIDELSDAIFAEIRNLRESGPKEDEIADVKKSLLRDHETGIENNAYWLTRVATSYSIGINPGAELVLKQSEAVNAVTAENAKDTFKKYYNLENYIQVTLLPEEQGASDN